MSRTIIGAIVGVAIAVLTAVCYVVVTGGLADRVKADAKLQMSIARIPAQAQNNARLDLLNTQAQAETMAKDEGVVGALRTTATLDRVREADLAFSRFHSNNAGQTQPDVLALVDAGGNIVAMDGVNNPVASELKDKDGKLVWRGLALTLESGHTRPAIAEIWNYPGRGLMRTGVAAVVDRQTADGVPKIIGAVVIAYSQSSKLAREEQAVLGSEIAYFQGDKVYASSFRKGDNTEDARMQQLIAPLLARDDLKQAFSSDSGIVSPVTATIDGQTYLVGAVRMPRYPNTKALPADYPPVTAGALVLAPAGRNVPEHATAGRMVIVLGAIALLLALGAMWLSSRRILDQVDELEVGVAEIINGNLERTFRPVGADLDGLANGLNVMLARLLGRPEPGEEEMDDDGNPIVPGRVEFEDEDGAAAPPADSSSAELAALAREPEPDYYKRVYTEYLEARRATGHPDEVSFEGFIAKLRVNEGKLKAQHQCKAVRFRVVTKDGKVTLKPVPIF
ncbi:MAG: hypothetical protein K8M05_37325 [Deltaproteobacteria bacterium]|nr:hypothetical protein [Kofleriaceae bacterium]